MRDLQGRGESLETVTRRIERAQCELLFRKCSQGDLPFQAFNVKGKNLDLITALQLFSRNKLWSVGFSVSNILVFFQKDVTFWTPKMSPIMVLNVKKEVNESI